MVDAADAVSPSRPVQRSHELESGGRLAIQRDRNPFLECDLNVGWLVGTLARIACPRVDVFWWLGPRIFENSRFDRPAPQVLVRRVRRTRRGRHLHAAPPRLLALLVPIHLPL